MALKRLLVVLSAFFFCLSVILFGPMPRSLTGAPAYVGESPGSAASFATTLAATSGSA
jgi:hypothetical protein